VFDNVSLKLSDTDVLKDISFTVEPNKTLAIMGATGSGKTSILNTLTRFYDHTEGTITIDDIPIADYDLYNLRSHIAVVMQEVFLFSDTIEENILFGVKETTSHDEMIESSMSAQAHDFINRMDRQYQTVIGEKGIGLSGGQKQRISIARAIAKKSNILVLMMQLQHWIWKQNIKFNKKWSKSTM
jgi:ATP-binding cassette, subfamily B, multidrug efflux pump